MKRDVQKNTARRAALLGINKVSKQMVNLPASGTTNVAINSLIQRDNGQRKETEEEVLVNGVGRFHKKIKWR